VKVGYQFDFRNPPGSDRSFADVYRDMFRQAERAEELGFDSLWLTEHHFIDDGYLPALMPMASALAARTTRVAIGTYVLLAPFHHPVKLAEETAAYIDVIPAAQHKAVTKHARQTNSIERGNNTLRQRVSRLVCSTLAFSKKVENHSEAIRYFICHYHLTRAALPV
jgi:IS1 family transposase